MQTKIKATGPDDLPSWVPDAARNYLAHTERGQTIRALARQSNVHASTILRQVRRLEMLRDDPLVDDALRHLSHCLPAGPDADLGDHAGRATERKSALGPQDGAGRPALSEARIEVEGARHLRRLVEPGTILAVAREMEMGVIVREVPGGPPERIAVVERAVAEAMVLKDWIACVDPTARITRYHITAAGRAALRQLIAAAASRTRGFSEAQAEFDLDRAARAGAGDGVVRHMRTTLGESPLAALARRRDKDGKPFLDRALVAAGERLREDFELSQSGPRVTQNWESFLTGSDSGVVPFSRGPAPEGGAGAARDRVTAALQDLGPGLADVVLRCCCFLEGLENLEKRMGWSARSGKIVLRIALQRLHRHYRETQGKFGPKIG